MADAQGSTPPSPTPVDPRIAQAEEYLQSARARLAEQEAAQPRSRGKHSGDRRRVRLTLSVAPAMFLHVLQGAIALTLDFLALTLTYQMLLVDVTIGRVVGFGTGFLTAAVLGYLSACYLDLIESTSNGQANIELHDADWKEWFWTLPASLGMLALSAAVGWGLSLLLSVDVWWLVGISVFVTYPLFQISSLETGSPTAPLSLPVLRSLVEHPLAWLVLYAISFAVVSAVWLVAGLAWYDPPYATMLVLGPVVTVALFFYAWLLGQLVLFITADEET